MAIKLSHAGIVVSVLRSEVAALWLVFALSSMHSQFISENEINEYEWLEIQLWNFRLGLSKTLPDA